MKNITKNNYNHYNKNYLLSSALSIPARHNNSNFNSDLSALVWTAQVVLFEFVCFTKRDREAEIADLLEELCQKYFHQMAETPFGHILQWRLYLFSASRDAQAEEQARWSLDGQTINYRGTKLHMDQVPQLVSSEFRQAHSLLSQLRGRIASDSI